MKRILPSSSWKTTSRGAGSGAISISIQGTLEEFAKVDLWARKVSPKNLAHGYEVARAAVGDGPFCNWRDRRNHPG